MSEFNIKAMQEEKIEAHKALVALWGKDGEKRSALSAEDRQKSEELRTRITELQTKIQDELEWAEVQKLNASQGEQRVSVNAPAPRHVNTTNITDKDREYALRGYLIEAACRKNTEAEKYENREYKEAMHKVGLQAHKDYTFSLGRSKPFWAPQNEVRTFNGQGEGTWNQGSTVGAAGGFLTEQSHIIRELEVYTKWHSGMYLASRVINTDDGSLVWKPQLDDTANSASIHSELAQMDGLDVVFAHKSMPAFVYDSFVMASLELLQDSKLPLEEILSTDVLSVRIARKENTDYTVGSGSGAPLGIKTDVAANGTVFTSASAGTFTYADLVNWINTLDYSYLQDPSCAFMMSQSGYFHFLGLADSQGRPLANMSMDMIAPRDRLLGYSVVINNDMDSFAAGNTFGILGAWRASNIRNVGGLNIRVLNERFIYDNLAIGIGAWKRAGYACFNPKAFVNGKVHA